jgi:hypothetical protein
LRGRRGARDRAGAGSREQDFTAIVLALGHRRALSSGATATLSLVAINPFAPPVICI